MEILETKNFETQASKEKINKIKKYASQSIKYPLNTNMITQSSNNNISKKQNDINISFFSPAKPNFTFNSTKNNERFSLARASTAYINTDSNYNQTFLLNTTTNNRYKERKSIANTNLVTNQIEKAIKALDNKKKQFNYSKKTREKFLKNPTPVYNITKEAENDNEDIIERQKSKRHYFRDIVFKKKQEKSFSNSKKESNDYNTHNTERFSKRSSIDLNNANPKSTKRSVKRYSYKVKLQNSKNKNKGNQETDDFENNYKTLLEEMNSNRKNSKYQSLYSNNNQFLKYKLNKFKKQQTIEDLEANLIDHLVEQRKTKIAEKIKDRRKMDDLNRYLLERDFIKKELPKTKDPKTLDLITKRIYKLNQIIHKLMAEPKSKDKEEGKKQDLRRIDTVNFSNNQSNHLISSNVKINFNLKNNNYLNKSRIISENSSFKSLINKSAENNSESEFFLDKELLSPKEHEINNQFEKDYKIGKIIHDLELLDQEEELDLINNRRFKEAQKPIAYLEKFHFVRTGRKLNELNLFVPSSDVRKSCLFEKSFRPKGFTRDLKDKQFCSNMLRKRKKRLVKLNNKQLLISKSRDINLIGSDIKLSKSKISKEPNTANVAFDTRYRSNSKSKSKNKVKLVVNGDEKLSSHKKNYSSTSIINEDMENKSNYSKENLFESNTKKLSKFFLTNTSLIDVNKEDENTYHDEMTENKRQVINKSSKKTIGAISRVNNKKESNSKDKNVLLANKLSEAEKKVNSIKRKEYTGNESSCSDTNSSVYKNFREFERKDFINNLQGSLNNLNMHKYDISKKYLRKNNNSIEMMANVISNQLISKKKTIKMNKNPFGTLNSQASLKNQFQSNKRNSLVSIKNNIIREESLNLNSKNTNIKKKNNDDLKKKDFNKFARISSIVSKHGFGIGLRKSNGLNYHNSKTAVIGKDIKDSNIINKVHFPAKSTIQQKCIDFIDNHNPKTKNISNLNDDGRNPTTLNYNNDLKKNSKSTYVLSLNRVDSSENNAESRIQTESKVNQNNQYNFNFLSNKKNINMTDLLLKTTNSNQSLDVKSVLTKPSQIIDKNIAINHKANKNLISLISTKDIVNNINSNIIEESKGKITDWEKIMDDLYLFREKYTIIYSDKKKIEKQILKMKYEKEKKLKRAQTDKKDKVIYKMAKKMYKDEVYIIPKYVDVNNEEITKSYLDKIDKKSHGLIESIYKSQRYYDRLMCTDIREAVTDYERKMEMMKLDRDVKSLALKSMMLKSEKNLLFDREVLDEIKEAEKLNHWSFTEFFEWEINKQRIFHQTGYNKRIKKKW